MSQHDSILAQAERLAPHSVEAEEALLGSILIDPGALNDVAAFLQAHAQRYGYAMAGEPVEVEVTLARLRNKGGDHDA